MYLVTFVAMNVVFAALWTIETDGCCEDSTMTFWQHFDFVSLDDLRVEKFLRFEFSKVLLYSSRVVFQAVI